MKRTLLENGITRLCVFFGRQKGGWSLDTGQGCVSTGLWYCDDTLSTDQLGGDDTLSTGQ